MKEKSNYLKLHEKYIKLEKQNEELKCCGNCKYYAPCTFAVDKCYFSGSVGKTIGDGLCPKWKIKEVEGMKTYTIDEIINIINKSPVMIPIDEMFDDEGNHITKKKYGQVVIKYLCEELKEIN